MSYTYTQRKRPPGQKETAQSRNNLPFSDLNAGMRGQARYADARQGQSTDLNAAMQERMTNTFGDLSAVKAYVPPAMETTPATVGPYTGPVAHTLSAAFPSPSAAGPMQAKRESDINRAERIGAGILFDKDREKVYQGNIRNASQQASRKEGIRQGLTGKALDVFIDKRDNDVDYVKSFGKKPKKLVSKKEETWFYNKMRTGDSSFFRKVTKRSQAARDRLLRHRESMGPETGPDAKKLDYEASFSVPAQEKRIYDFMKQQAFGNPALQQLAQENPETPETEKKHERSTRIEASLLDDQKEGAPIRKALLNPKLRYLLLKSAGWNKEANKLLSDAGKKYRIKQGGMPSKKGTILNAVPNIMNEEPKPGPVTKTKEEIASDEADKVFRVGAGVLGDAKDVALKKDQIIDSVLPTYLEEEKQKGGKDYARRANRRAEQYYKEHTPKRKNMTSAEDKKWYYNITNHASLDLIGELKVRRKQAALDLNEYRENQGLEHPDEDKHKLDFESAYSDQGRKLDIYDYILGDMTNSPAMEQYMEQHPDFEESEEEQIKVENAFSLLSSGNGGKYVDTEEGKQNSLRLRKQEMVNPFALVYNFCTFPDQMGLKWVVFAIKTHCIAQLIIALCAKCAPNVRQMASSKWHQVILSQTVLDQLEYLS